MIRVIERVFGIEQLKRGHTQILGCDPLLRLVPKNPEEERKVQLRRAGLRQKSVHSQKPVLRYVHHQPDFARCRPKMIALLLLSQSLLGIWRRLVLSLCHFFGASRLIIYPTIVPVTKANVSPTRPMYVRKAMLIKLKSEILHSFIPEIADFYDPNHHRNSQNKVCSRI
jgi:hypothetical protein